jgi:hypothetical protein
MLSPPSVNFCVRREFCRGPVRARAELSRSLPRYFFDFTDSGKRSRDDEGVELASLEEARREALRCLSEIAKTLDGNRHKFTIQIRPDGGAPVLSASLTLHVQTHEPSSN